MQIRANVEMFSFKFLEIWKFFFFQNFFSETFIDILKMHYKSTRINTRFAINNFFQSISHLITKLITFLIILSLVGLLLIRFLKV